MRCVCTKHKYKPQYIRVVASHVFSSFAIPQQIYNLLYTRRVCCVQSGAFECVCCVHRTLLHVYFFRVHTRTLCAPHVKMLWLIIFGEPARRERHKEKVFEFICLVWSFSFVSYGRCRIVDGTAYPLVARGSLCFGFRALIVIFIYLFIFGKCA